MSIGELWSLHEILSDSIGSQDTGGNGKAKSAITSARPAGRRISEDKPLAAPLPAGEMQPTVIVMH